MGPGTKIERLCFNPALSSALMDKRSNVGAFIRGKGGAVVTSTTVGPSEALDVNLVNGIVLSVDLDGVYVDDTNLLPDSVGNIFHVRNAAPDITHQTFRSTGATPTADALDPLTVHGIDVNSYLHAYNGTTYDRLTSKAKELESRDTAKNIDNKAVSVGDTATQIAATPLSNRKGFHLQNLGDDCIYIGKDNTVTVANGTEIAPCSSAYFAWDEAVDPYAITNSGSIVDTRLLEEAS